MKKYYAYLDNTIINTFTNKAKAVKWAYNKVMRDKIDCIILWQTISTDKIFRSGTTEIYVTKEEVGEYDMTKRTQRHKKNFVEVQFLKGYGKIRYRGKRHGRKSK